MDADKILNNLFRWADANEMVFKITENDGVFAIAGTDGTIGAEYVIDEARPHAVGRAMLAAIDAIKHGSEFHKAHGLMPDTAEVHDGMADASRAGQGGEHPGEQGIDGTPSQRPTWVTIATPELPDDPES